MTTYLIIAIVSYLLGSIPFGYILVRIFTGKDIRESGSGNIGATNVARSGTKGLAIATLLLDAGKGAFAVVGVLAVFFGALIHDPEWTFQLAALAGLFAILGHMFPVWLKFRGGKGVATAVGAFAAIAPGAIVVSLLVFLAVVAICRYVSLGSIIAAAVFPVAVYFLPPRIASHTGLSIPLLITIGFASAVIISRHHANIRRLLAGTESKFGAKKIPPPEQMGREA